MNKVNKTKESVVILLSPQHFPTVLQVDDMPWCNMPWYIFHTVQCNNWASCVSQITLVVHIWIFIKSKSFTKHTVVSSQCTNYIMPISLFQFAVTSPVFQILSLYASLLCGFVFLCNCMEEGDWERFYLGHSEGLGVFCLGVFCCFFKLQNYQITVWFKTRVRRWMDWKRLVVEYGMNNSQKALAHTRRLQIAWSNSFNKISVCQQ